MFVSDRMAKTALRSLLGQKKEKEVLMNFQKTKNCRDRKKMEERAEKRRDVKRKAYMVRNHQDGYTYLNLS